MKTMSILGVIFSVLFFLFSFLVLDNSGISKEEFIPFVLVFCLWCLSLSIVGIAGINRNPNK